MAVGKMDLRPRANRSDAAELSDMLHARLNRASERQRAAVRPAVGIRGMRNTPLNPFDTNWLVSKISVKGPCGLCVAC